MVPFHKVLGPMVRLPISKTTSSSFEIIPRNTRLTVAPAGKTYSRRPDTYGEPWYSSKGSKGASLRVSFLGAYRPAYSTSANIAFGKSIAPFQRRAYSTRNHWVSDALEVTDLPTPSISLWAGLLRLSGVLSQ